MEVVLEINALRVAGYRSVRDLRLTLGRVNVLSRRSVSSATVPAFTRRSPGLSPVVR